jgi:FHS family L-fucose permease-like MFS transporter
VVPYVAFGVILFVNHLYGNDITELLPYAGVIAIAIIAFFLGNKSQ